MSITIGRRRISRLLKPIEVYYRLDVGKWASIILKPGSEIVRDIVLDVRAIKHLSHGDVLDSFLEFIVNDKRHTCSHIIFKDDLDDTVVLGPVDLGVITAPTVSRSSQ